MEDGRGRPSLHTHKSLETKKDPPKRVFNICGSQILTRSGESSQVLCSAESWSGECYSEDSLSPESVKSGSKPEALFPG